MEHAKTVYKRCRFKNDDKSFIFILRVVQIITWNEILFLYKTIKYTFKTQHTAFFFIKITPCSLWMGFLGGGGTPKMYLQTFKQTLNETTIDNWKNYL